jgi:DNA-binding MarR family transcriptional regulator
MTVSGEVAFKVKQFIAARERFTIGQVAKLTGLKHKSVETVVQRLVRDGYVVKSRETVPGTGRGRRPLYYTLTADMEKRRGLVNEVSAFQPGAVPVRVHPLSANYVGAHNMLDELEREPNAPDRETRLAKIEKHLELAAFEEGLEDGEEGTAVVQAYLLRERARVAALRHQWPRAESLLNQAWAIFQEHGLEEEANKVRGMIASQELERVLTEGPLDHGRLSHISECLNLYEVASVPVSTVCRLVGAFQETLQAATAVEREEEITWSLARSLETMARQQLRGEVVLLVARELEKMAKLELSKVGTERVSEEVTKELAAIKKRKTPRILRSTGTERQSSKMIPFGERSRGASYVYV